MSRMITALQNANIERQVEDTYNEALKKCLGENIDIKYPYACDGCFEFEVDGKSHKLIIEYKLDTELGSKVARARVLAQVVFYLKRFENAGEPFPDVCMVADKNECFVMHTNPLLKHLDIDNIPWEKAPSSAGNFPELLMAIADDPEINPFVFDVNVGFNFWDVVEKIKAVASGTVRQIRITEHNVDRVFKMFSEKVIKEKMQPNDLVGLFFGVVTGNEDIYLHPAKKNVLVSAGKNIRVDSEWYKAFCGHFSTNCTPKDKARLAAISDRLIEDTNRRRKGEFYTPTPFVDHAHRMIEKAFGEDWKEKYVVWDNCCGTKNLTRDYKFKELYCSTLEPAELEIAEKYNPEATSFVFDFLNDPLEKLPQGLLNALKGGKKILFFLNPPYGTAGNGINTGSKGSVCKTQINSEMTKIGFGRSSAQLFAQFLYRITKIKQQFNADVSIALLCNPVFMVGDSYVIFRNYFLTNFQFETADLFNASHFADVKGDWGISLSLWRSGETLQKDEFVHQLIDQTEEGEIVSIGQKTLYNTDHHSDLRKWIKEGLSGIKVDFPNFASALAIREHGKKWYQGSLGTLHYFGNSVRYSTQGIYMSSGIATTAAGAVYHCSVLPNNFSKCAAAFAARKLIEDTWIDHEDQFLAPDESNPKLQEFVNDSIVYSLFHSYSNQASLRAIDYKGKLWNIPNEFFWLPKSTIEDLANECNNDDCYNDAHTSKERYVAQLLPALTLSPEAQGVLDKATELLKKSFKYRPLFNDEHPEYQINNWDCGWYQIKALLKQYLPDDLKEFKALFDKLADKMRPQVYELGFLKK